MGILEVNNATFQSAAILEYLSAFAGLHSGSKTTFSEFLNLAFAMIFQNISSYYIEFLLFVFLLNAYIISIIRQCSSNFNQDSQYLRLNGISSAAWRSRGTT